MQSFDDYYTWIYLPAHQKTATRVCHLIGNLATIVWFFWALSLVPSTMGWVLLILTPFIVYPFAIPSHYLFEGNKPVLFSNNPIYAKMSDIRMCWEFMIGEL